MKWLPVVIAIFVASSASAGPSSSDCSYAYRHAPRAGFIDPLLLLTEDEAAKLQETKAECIRLAEEGDAEYQDALGARLGPEGDLI